MATPPAQIPHNPPALGMQSNVRDDVRRSTFLLAAVSKMPNDRVGVGLDTRHRRVLPASDVSYTSLCTRMLVCYTVISSSSSLPSDLPCPVLFPRTTTS
jgi:hypothetical protein